MLTEKTLTETLFPCRLKVQIHNNSNICVLYAQYVYWHCTGHEKLKVQSKWTKRVCSCPFHPTSDVLQQLLQVLQVFRFYSTSSQTCIANTAMLCIMTLWRLHNEINEKVTELDRGTPVWWNVSEKHLTSPSNTALTLSIATRKWKQVGRTVLQWVALYTLFATFSFWLPTVAMKTLDWVSNTPPHPLYTEAVWSTYAHSQPHPYPHPNTSTPSPKASHPYPHTPTLTSSLTP